MSATLEHQVAVMALDIKKLERQRAAIENARLAIENLKLALDYGILTQEEFVAKGRALIESSSSVVSPVDEANKKSAVMFKYSQG